MIVFLACFGAFFTPVVVLYLLRRRVRKTVSSLLLWFTPGAQQSASGLIKPREALSLLLHACFLACLSVALASGWHEGSAVLPTRVVIVETGGRASRVYEAWRLDSLKQQVRKALESDYSMRHMLVELAWRAEILC